MMRFFITTVISLGFAVMGKAQEVATSVAEVTQAADPVRPMYERFGMTSTHLFILMVSVSILLVAILFGLASNAKHVMYFSAKSLKDKGAKILILGMLFSGSISTFAGEPYEQIKMEIPFPDSSFWALLVFDILLVILIVYFSGIINGFLYQFVAKRKSRFWKGIQNKLVDLPTPEQEVSLVMDHEYDGIRELDNNLPPWWKYGFYVTIVWAIVYFSYYTIFGGPSQHEEFTTSVIEGERELAEYKASHPELITSETVSIMTDEGTLSKGRTIFKDKCVTCHMDGGAGGAGPNLTDDYWIYGRSIERVFTIISEGADNGMKSWKNELNGIEIQAVASYLLQLPEILPPNGQEPKGEYYPPKE